MNSTNPLCVFFAGPPKAGKSVIGKESIARPLDIPYLGMGALLRSKNQVPEHHGLAPDETVIPLAMEWIYHRRKNHVPIIFCDGFPRNILQAQKAIPSLKKLGFELWTVWLSKPLHACITELPRPDRKEEDTLHIRKRYRVYQEETVPMQPLLKKETRYLEFDTAHRVFSEVIHEITLALELDHRVKKEKVREFPFFHTPALI